MLSEQPLEKRVKITGQLRYCNEWLYNIISGLNMRLLEYEGKNYLPNLPVEVVNAEDWG